jgi:hypothetical protein
MYMMLHYLNFLKDVSILISCILLHVLTLNFDHNMNTIQILSIGWWRIVIEEFVTMEWELEKMEWELGKMKKIELIRKKTNWF